jgi:pimeloyl-ACP methyl ester carboxylesterase
MSLTGPRTGALRSVGHGSRWRRALRELTTMALALAITVTVAAAAYDVSSRRTLPVPPLDAHGHTVRAGGLTTHYEQWGRTGLPIVLVHGFLESSAVWSRLGPVLARDGFRVFALDVRGYGYTQRRGPYTLAADTAQLQAFLTALHLDRSHDSTPLLVGHSSGAAVVGNLARTAPAAVRRVVFMDGDGTPYGVGPAWVHRLLVEPFATALIRLATRHPWLAGRVYRDACGDRCPPFDAATWLRPFRVAGAESALKAILRQQVIGLSFAQERQIEAPAAVLYGGRDPQMTAADAQATAARLHTDLVAPIPGAGHLGMLSDPEALASLLTRLSR